MGESIEAVRTDMDDVLQSFSSNGRTKHADEPLALRYCTMATGPLYCVIHRVQDFLLVVLAVTVLHAFDRFPAYDGSDSVLYEG